MTITYNGYPASASPDGYDVAIIGYPSDAGCASQGGQRDGPAAIRGCAYWPPEDIFDAQSQHTLKLSVCDLGDVKQKQSIQETGEILSDYVAQTVGYNTVPIVLGGDDSLTYYCLRAIKPRVTVLHFDAHSDLWNPSNGYLDHGSWMAKSLDDKIIADAFLFGHRCFGPNKKTWRKYEKKGHNGFHALDSMGCVNDLVEGAVARSAGSAIWLAIDLDVFDPAFAPSVGSKEPMGLYPAELLPAFQTICSDYNVVGVSVTELLPALDLNGATSILASHVVMRCLLGLSQHKAGTP